MDENTWRFAQLMMWLIGVQTAFLSTILGVIWSKLNKIEKEQQQQGTRIAVIETRISDMGNNVNHLMWHSQALPHKEAHEE